MKKHGALIGFLLIFAIQTPAFSSMERAEFDQQLSVAIAKLNRDAGSDAEGREWIAGLIQSQYGTSPSELQWAGDKSLSLGETVLFAYIQATTGRSFEQITSENAQRDFWTYAENAGMNCDKMALSLTSFLKRAEKERNSRIFDRLRISRRIHPLPDLGSGFGLFQEALDFRRIDSPGPVKIHADTGLRVKSEDGPAGN